MLEWVTKVKIVKSTVVELGMKASGGKLEVKLWRESQCTKKIELEEHMRK